MAPSKLYLNNLVVRDEQRFPSPKSDYYIPPPGESSKFLDYPEKPIQVSLELLVPLHYESYGSDGSELKAPTHTSQGQDIAGVSQKTLRCINLYYNEAIVLDISKATDDLDSLREFGNRDEILGFLPEDTTDEALTTEVIDFARMSSAVRFGRQLWHQARCRMIVTYCLVAQRFAVAQRLAIIAKLLHTETGLQLISPPGSEEDNAFRERLQKSKVWPDKGWPGIGFSDQAPDWVSDSDTCEPDPRSTTPEKLQTDGALEEADKEGDRPFMDIDDAREKQNSDETKE